MASPRHTLIRSLFEEYVELYESGNDLLTTRLSENFCGDTGGGHFLATAGFAENLPVCCGAAAFHRVLRQHPAPMAVAISTQQNKPNVN